MIRGSGRPTTSQKAGYVPVPYFLKLPKCEAIEINIIFYSHVTETRYHKKASF